MTDIASLGIEIKTDSVKQAADDLDKLNQKGKESEGAADKAGEAWSKAASKISGDTGQIIRELQQLNARQDAAAQTFTKISSQIESASVSFLSAAQSIGKFRDESAKVGSAASSVAPAVEKTTVAVEHQSDALTALAAKIDPLISAFARLDFSALGTQISSASTSFQSAAFSIERYREELSKTASASTQIPANASKVAKAVKDESDALAELLGRIDPVVGALGRLDKMEESLRGFKGAGAIGAEDFALYQSKIQAMRDSLVPAEEALNRTGNTAKQTAQALRMLPAQFTDIATGLATGQSPFTVLLQQGGQIKDQFGGIGPAISAVGRYALSLVNPFTAAAAAVGLLAVAYKQGSDEQTAYAKALITTGNAAGTTSDQLAVMAKQVSGTVGTTSQAADALTQLASTGKIAQDQLQGLATAAVAWESATGKAVSETVAEFSKLADNPVKASQELNEQYHYLTAAVYEQISALQEQGRTDEAAEAAQSAYADALNERAGKVKESLGTIETAWNAVKSAAKNAWDAVLDIGREATLDERIQQLRDRLAEVAAAGSSGPQGRARFQLGLGGGGEGDSRQELAFLEQQKQTQEAIARAQANYREEQDKGIAAQKEVDAIEKQFLTNAEKRTKEIKEYRRQLEDIRKANPNDARLDEDRIAKNIANIESKYKDPKTPRTKAYRDDAGERMLLQLKQEEASLQTQLLGENKLTDAQKKRAEFEQLIAELKEKKVLTADQKSLLASQEAIKAQLTKNVAVAEEVRLHNESMKLQERIRQLQETMGASNDSRQEQYQRQLDAFGMGSEQLRRLREQQSIIREFQRYRAQLDKSTPKDLLGSDEYKDAVDQIKKGLDDSLKAHDDYYKKLEKLQDDWAKGAKGALQDYVDGARNSAKDYYDLFNNALSGLEDSLTTFVMTGKLSFKDLANSIIEDLVRIQIRKTIAFGIEAFQGSSLYGSLFGTAQADGGAWAGGVQMFANGGAFTNSIVSRPTAFGMRNGRTGVMGEAGPEAIMPLMRTPDGALGVRVAANDSGSSSPSVTHYNTFSFPNITNANEARQATAVAARNFNAVSQRAARFS